MKIPDTTANVGAYYGNEENGQWQPNGLMIDSGVGGGIVGSGDAGIHRPAVYPVHIPRAHIPGYVMTGAYYPHGYPQPAAAPPDDFADYMWMENEEEFEKEVMQQLEEEALMEQCIEAMLEDEQRERQRPRNGHNAHYATTSNGASLQETVSRSTLNPLAKEFVPTRVITQPHIENKPSPPPEPSPQSADSPTDSCLSTPSADDKTAPIESPPPPPATPEVSAAEVCVTDNSDKPKPEVKTNTSKPEVKTNTSKQEVKTKLKPLPAKSETKVAPKKKEMKTVKSETTEEDNENVATPVVEVKQTSPAPAEEVPTGPKPINYAAAAKANKPKPKPATTNPPDTEKVTPPPQKDKKPEKKPPTKKTTPPTKPVQRKNSTK